ncbi:putative disease resistance protein At3g14460 [Arachis stenosperma]|uniref:putative disease resistance protein At3g14460 n=1 Tax=Arachis stenosperma TaxID=217475 RepID=UPI0025ACE692|nr:putative disease resistance protein At3g14460 [Arachis stenosperma]
MEQFTSQPLSSSSKKDERRLIESHRRNLMKNLYSKLNSLQPNSNTTKALPDQLDEAINYIKSLEEKVKMAEDKKQSLLVGKKKRSRPAECSSSSITDSMAASTSLELVMATCLDTQFIFHEIIRVLHEDHHIDFAHSELIAKLMDKLLVLDDLIEKLQFSEGERGDRADEKLKWLHLMQDVVRLEEHHLLQKMDSVDSMSLQKLLKRFKSQICQILYFILMKGKKDNLVLALAIGKEEDLHTLPELPLSYVKDSLYGRGEEERYILESLLLSSEQQKQIKVISIVGKSGVGKTSLADVVYFNPKVLECFDLRAWVTFSHKVTATFVAKKILEELVTDDDGEEELVPGDDFDNLKKRFAGKKLLLVLDDIMVEDDGLHKWDMFIASLESAAARGSAIMLTSIPHDNPELLMIPACHTVHLDSLSAEDALSIFLVHASSGRTDLHEHPGELAAVGKEIVGKLGNLPLAAKMIGSLFQDKRNPDQWAEILRSELLDVGHANLLPIPPFLVLCYLDLPARIKQCFLHLSVFPKGYQLKRKQVVNLWIAEGFVESPDFQSSFKSSEDIGNAYFSYLVMRSFLQPIRSSVSFIMHNLVHDLATYMVEKLNDCHLSSNQSTEGISNLINLLHLDMKGSSVQGMPLKIPEFTRLEKLARIEETTMSEFEEIPDEAKMETKSARRRSPLHLSASNIPSLKRTDILSHEVEADIPSFEQQIDPKSSMAKAEIPASIKQEAVLPLMDTPNTTAPVKVEALTREDLDHDKPSFKVLRVSTISQFKSLPANLYSLKIEGCESLEVVPDDILGGITTLKQLYLISCSSLRSFSYPGSLTSLYIRNCRRLEFLPSAVSRKRLPFLHHLSIGSSCDSVTTLPLNIFCQLKSLCIWDCLNLRSFDFTGEPRGDLTSLESLEIRECPRLESFPEEGLHAPRLASILLSNCKNLKNLPNAMNSLASLKSLFLHSCPQIESFPLGGLPSNLVFLSIAYCDKLTPQKDWGLYSLESLSYFELEGGCIGMESFPEENLLPCNIISLHISTLKSLKNLDCKGFQHLNALQTLEIHCCDMLQSLSNHGLPSSLENLCIQECPLLTNKLESMMGDEWHKVAHIPDIQIDHQVLS